MKGARTLISAMAWILRIAAGVGILACLGLSLLKTDRAARAASAALVERIKAATGRPARVGSCALSLFPPAADIRDLVVAGPDGTFDHPLLAARRTSASLSMEDLLRGRVTVDEIEVDGVELRYEPGASPSPGPVDREAQGAAVEVRQILVRHGTLIFLGSAAPFSLEAAGIEAAASSGGCGTRSCVDGTVRAGAFRAAYGDHVLAGDAVEAIFSLDPTFLDIRRFSVKGAGMSGSGSAGWRTAGGGAARISARVVTTGAAAEALLGKLPVTADSIDLTATVAVVDAAVQVQGHGKAVGAGYPGLASAPEAEGSFRLEGGVLTLDVTASKLTPILPGPPAASTGALTAHITRDAEGACVARVSLTPVLYRDLLGFVDRRLPVADVTARVEGTVTWRAGDAATLDGSLAVVVAPFAPGRPPSSPAASAAPPSIALAGSLEARPGPRSVALRGARFSFPGVVFGFEGEVFRDRRGFDADVTIEEADSSVLLAALRHFPAAAALGGQERFAGEIAGRAHIAMDDRDVTACGDLRGESLSLRPGASVVPISSARTAWRYGHGRLNLDGLEARGDGWSAAGSLLLDSAYEEPLRAGRVELRDVPGDPFWSAFGLVSMSGGTVSGGARIDFDAPARTDVERTPQPGISLTARGATYAGVPIAELSLAADAWGPAIDVRRLVAASAAGTVEAVGSYTPRSGDGKIRVRSEHFDVAALSAMMYPAAHGQSGFVTLQGDAVVSRTRAAFNGTARATGLTVLGVAAGDVTADIAAGPEGTRASVVAPELSLTGSFGWPASGGAIELDLLLDGMPLERIRPLLPPGTLSGLAGKGSGRVWGTIPTREPRTAELTGRITALTLDAGGMALAIDGESELTLRDGELWLGRTRVRGPQTDLTISGVYDVRTGAAGAGNASGRFDAAFLKLAFPELDAQGVVEIDLHANSGDDGLVYGGKVTTTLESLRFPGAPLPLDDLRMSATAAPDGSLDIESVAFNFAGGEVAGTGRGKLRGIELASSELHLHGSNLQMAPLPDLTILFDASLEIVRGAGEATMKGRMDVVRAIYNREFELEASPDIGRVRTAPGERPLNTLPSPALDIEVVAPSEVLVRNNAARLEGAARLHITGTFAQPEITGRISVFDGGTFRFREVTYRTEGGGIDFDDPDVVDPLLDLTARTQVQAYEITLHVLGRYSTPRFELTSEPALPTRDIVSLLVTGKTYAETYGQESGVALAAEENVGQYLTAPLTGSLSNTVGRALNLTSVQIEPQFFNGRADPTARITLTKRISPQLLFVYSDSLGANQEQIYQFQYDLSRAWQLVGTRNPDGTSSGDLRFRHRWSLGTPPPKPAAAARGSPATEAQASEFTMGRAEISEIDVTGFDGDATPLRKSLGLKTGRTYARGDVLEAREKLRAWLTRHSYPMASVRLTVRGAEGEGGAVELTYDVSAGPRVDTEVTGIRRSRAINKVIADALDRTVGRDQLGAAGAEALRTELGAKGYASAVVKETTQGREDRIRITYEVDRGPKASVRSIRIEGAAAVPEIELRRAMETVEDRWNTSGTLRTPTLKADAEAVRSVYLAHGFLDARVPEPEIKMSPDRKSADVTLRVEEGEVWTLREVTLSGRTTYPAESLREATLLVPGTPIRPSAVDAAVERVRDVLDANGYNQVRVRSRTEGPPATAKVTLEIEEGPRQVLSSVSIHGNTRTNSSVISREIPLKPGDPISRNGLLIAQRKLYGLGIFRSVDLKVVPEREGEEAARLVVTVAEGSPLLTAFGVGYNTEQSLQEFAQIGHDNVFGTGRAASLFLSHSSLQRRAQVNLTDRRLFGIPFEGLITAFWEKDERPSFEERRAGGAIQLKDQPTKQWTVLGRYAVEDVALLNVDPNLDPATDIGEQDVRLANVAASLAQDGRDDILNPTRGGFVTADARLYLAAVGSERQFSRVYASWAWFHPVSARTVFGTSFRIGHERPLGSTTDIPLAERFFAGGDTTLRGFGIDGAGPLDLATLQPIGGQFSVILNEELRFPILGALKGVVFYDTGNVFLTSNTFRFTGTDVVRRGSVLAVQDGFRHTLGTGIRFDTPLGPIRVEYGRKLDPKSDSFCLAPGCPMGSVVRRHESRYQLFLSVGQSF